MGINELVLSSGLKLQNAKKTNTKIALIITGNGNHLGPGLI